MEPDHPEPTCEQATVTHVRASTLGGLFREIDAQGAAVRTALIDSLSAPARTSFREPLGPFQWIEAPLLGELVAAYEAKFGLENIDRRVQYTVQQQLTVIHSWILRLLTPETMFHQAPTLYHFNFRGGIARTEEIRPGHALVFLWSLGLYPSWYTHAFPSWLTGSLHLIGALSVQVVHHPPETGYRHCYEATWTQ
jgi:hypothetical protein